MGSGAVQSGHTYAAPSELRRLLEASCPTSVLAALGDKTLPELGIYKAEALLDLDRLHEAYAVIDPLVEAMSTSKLEGDLYAEAERLRSVILLRGGWVDGSILGALRAAHSAQEGDLRAAALAWSAAGLARKNCWSMAEANLREAIEMAPNAPQVLMAQARVRLEADLRMEAREIFERMRKLGSAWAQVYGTWGCSYVAYLVGEFDQATAQAETALKASGEIVAPLFVIGQVALAREDEKKLEEMVSQLGQRSPMAESLSYWEEELESLRLRMASSGKGQRKRLEAFPTLVQRRDFCGPSTVELVMRYWKGGAGFSNDQIAEKVKLAQTGTPIYRMREFFHLAGFDTVRTLVSIEKIKSLIEAGFPAIIQEEFSNTSHVAVIIGYDEEAGCVELQDPMTHVVTRTSVEELNRLRKTYLDAALIAFPRGRGLKKTLAHLGLFDQPALVWCDQAVLELDQNRFQSAIAQAGRAVKIQPALGLGWVLLLHAKLESWRLAQNPRTPSPKGLAARLNSQAADQPTEARASFYASLEEAKRYHPQAEFIFQFEGSGALLDQDIPQALAAFQRAVEADAEDARNYANLAECYYLQREFDKACETAAQAMEHDPRLPAANAWLGRALAAANRKDAEHYGRMAVDLSPDWWVSHLTLAEAFLQQNQLQGARREVELGLSLSPGQPEARALRGVVLARMDESVEAASELQAVLESPTLYLVTAYQVYQALARISFGARLFDAAIENIRHLLNLAPDDPWGLQFLAAAGCENWLQQQESLLAYKILAYKILGYKSLAMGTSEYNLDESTLEALQLAYEQAIRANQGEAGVVRDYLSYLESLAGLPACLLAVERLREAYPENGNLCYWQGRLLGKAGNKEASTQYMLEALGRRDGVMNRDELYEAVAIILKTAGLEEAEKAILEKPIVEGGAPAVERQRALGLALALSPGEYSERARELLLLALSVDAEDATVMLRLGDVSQADEDRELCYRRALMLGPGWATARANLANFLIDHGQEMEAWEFTSGHSQESLELMAAHGRALFGMGHYEEAVSAFEQAMAMSTSAMSTSAMGEEDDPVLYENLWLAQLRSGLHKAALKTARQGLKLFGDEPKWYVRVAASLREMGRFDEARTALEKGNRKGLNEEDVLKAEYEMAWMQKDYDMALQVIEDLINTTGEKAGDGRLGWAEARYLHLLVAMGRFEEASQFLLQENLDASGWGEAAWAILLTDENELLLELAERALSLDPDQYSGLFTRVEALSRLDREEEALAAIQRLLEVYPEEHNAYEKLALRLAAVGELERAFEYAEQCVELGVFCPYAWATRGLVHFLSGRLEEAREDLQSGWMRADHQRREKLTYFWWLLAVLQGEADLAERRKIQAYQEARTELERRILGLIEAVLAD